jgi:uncharacterized OsmC-like protein
MENQPNDIRARWLGEDRFELTIRDHAVVVDQPLDNGGEDTGPTPTELFVAALAGCVGFYARRYLRRRDLPADGLVVRTTYEMASTPARVGAIDVAIELPAGVPEGHVDRLLAVASHCTVHNTLTQAPEVQVRLVEPAMP